MVTVEVAEDGVRVKVSITSPATMGLQTAY